MDAVQDGKLTGKLTEVEGDRARVEFQGQLVGHDDGVRTAMEIRGKLNVDLPTRAVRWLAVGIGENRNASPAGPALKAQARLRAVFEPADDAEELIDQRLEALDLAEQIANPGSLQLTYVSESAGFQIVHDRAWHPISERSGPVVLRRIEQGRVVAQCNISKLNRLPAGSELTLAQFEEEIRQALGTSFGSITESDASTTPQQLRQLRVTAGGTVSQVPIQWMYYHLNDDDGNRWSAVFTCEADRLEDFAGQDSALMNSLTAAQAAEPDLSADPAPSARRSPATAR
jgi:hypothetical protein